jgi:protein-L-isoaspartate(D-aspartate) O-methyltransferase
MPSIDATVDQFRSFYASCMAAAARQPAWPPGYAWQTRLEGAFEAVPREMFLPPGPWHIEAAPGGYVETPNADIRFLYQDVLVAIDKERGINNGQPSGHARFMGQLEPRPGETVVHIGAGTGYYTAILSVLVTPGGRVSAFELHEDLAARARHNLQSFDNVSITTGDATGLRLPAADVIYVNAGVIRPPLNWLLALRGGGRMFVPWRYRPLHQAHRQRLRCRSRDARLVYPVRRRLQQRAGRQATWARPCLGQSVFIPENGARA